MNSSLQNRTALVTGANRGIGRAIANLLAAEGARIAIHFGSDRTAAKNVLAELPGEGHAIFQANLTQKEEATVLPHQAAEKLGRLDMVINNAGIFEPHGIDTMSAEDWQKAWDRTATADEIAQVVLLAVSGRADALTGGIIDVNCASYFR